MTKGIPIGAIVAITSLAAYALVSRLLALSQPYHQDEYKWAFAANPDMAIPASAIPHPFLGKFLYHLTGELVGYDNLRILPVFLFTLTLTFLFVYLRERFGKLVSFLAVATCVVSFYGLLASVQIDIDGSLLLLATIVSILGYSRLLHAFDVQKRREAIAILTLGLLIGFSTKLSFFLVPAAFLIDAIIRRPALRAALLRTQRLILFGIALAFLGTAFFLLHDDVVFLKNIANFVAFEGRNYAEIMFLTIKALIYLSPIIPIGMLIGFRHVRSLSFWYIFLGLNILFYFVLFDFSHRTLDKYLMFLIMPGAVMAAVSLAAIMRSMIWKRVHYIWSIGAFFLFLLTLHMIFTMPHTVIPLLPKEGFVDAFVSLSWAFLLPFSGGSGPLGFYLPWDGIALAWTISLFAAAAVLWGGRRYVRIGLVTLIAVSLAYNMLVTTEYLLGNYYGSGPKVLSELLAQINGGGHVITYNAIGVYDLREHGFQVTRFYPHPQFIPGNGPIVQAHDGLFLVIGIPALNPASVYARYFSTCKTVATAEDGVILGAVLDCRTADKSIFDGNPVF